MSTPAVVGGRGWLSAVVVAVLVALAMPALATAAPPTATVAVSPAAPETGQLVTFTATATDPDGDALAFEWHVGGVALDGADQATATTTFPSSGTYTVTLKVTDATGETFEASQPVTVTDPPPPPPNAPPVATFTIDPPAVVAGRTVTFTSTSVDSDGQVVAQAWDLDGDGMFDDGTGVTQQWTYGSAGAVVVALQVTDNSGASTVATGQVDVVPNQPPLAGFSFRPSTPRAGEAVTFSSTSTDRDGSIQQLRWELDGDGRSDDGTGPTATRVFGEPGSHLVALTATDDLGLSTTAFDTVQVSGGAPTALGDASPAAALPAPASVSGARRALMLSPFPIVRMRGVIRGGAVLVQILSVRANRGTRIVVTCRGAACPARRVVRVVRSGRRVVRFRAFERSLRAGVVLEVRVTQRGRIGKYTRFKMRANAPPARRDLCMRFGARRPSRCPVE